MENLVGRWRYEKRKRRRTRKIVIHRTGGPDWPKRTEDLIDALLNHPHGWGGKVPYTFFVEATGRIVQAAPIDRVTPHAWKRNPDTLGIAFIGDFRVQMATEIAYRNGGRLVRELRKMFGLSVEDITRHDLLSRGSKYPDKKCPGPLLDVAQLRFRAG
ncbi:MAG: peptidoglycan recognition protein family protein [Acidimicrobiales bacterium]